MSCSVPSGPDDKQLLCCAGARLMQLARLPLTVHSTKPTLHAPRRLRLWHAALEPAAVLQRALVRYGPASGAAGEAGDRCMPCSLCVLD